VNVLGIDTATAASAACVLRADGEAFEALPAAERLTERPGHAGELMPAVADCLGEAGLEWRELDAIAVGVGPGMFTGLRIGVATARALAQSLAIDLLPVSSLAALAAGGDASGDPAGDGGGPPGRVLAVIDARRGEVFAALYEGARAVWEPFVGSPEELADRLRGASLKALAVGDGAVRFHDVLEQAGAEVPESDSAAHVVRGLAICRLAATAAPTPIEAVLPDYLRLPDAKPRTA
jgi:tRNA threonylcarbamoyladenosine biosynthesis protein TsaB